MSKFICILSFFFSVLFSQVFVATAQAGSYSIKRLGTLPGATESTANDINNAGQVVGVSDPDLDHAFIWKAGIMRDLGNLPSAVGADACAINNLGQVVGEAYAWTILADHPLLHAFIWDENQGMQDLGTLSVGIESSASGINDVGQVIGVSVPPTQSPGSPSSYAFLWDEVNGMRDLSYLTGGTEVSARAINNLGQVVGTSNLPDGSTHAFLWDAINGMRDLGTLSGGSGSSASGINNAGHVVGTAEDINSMSVPFIWDAVQGMSQLPTLPSAVRSEASAINNADQVVGWSRMEDGTDHAFIWDAVNGIQDLGALPGGTEARAFAINDAGQIVGRSNILDEEGEEVVQAVLWSPDSDGDGLWDSWEEFGFDANNDGIVDVDLPAMGADKNHKDIFIEIDYMVGAHSHQPSAAALQTLINAFNGAPVDNPDGMTGIRLHVDAGPDSIMNPVTSQTWGSLSRASALSHIDTLGGLDANGYDWSDFDALKQTNFDAARLPIFHYTVFAHDLGDIVGVSGISRNTSDFAQGANDFIVSLGSWTNGVGSDDEQGGTLMHELGHNLGLRHGGGDDIHYKPNYLSVMNYSFQTTGLIVGGNSGLFDYSRFTPPDLDENNLDETVGLNGGGAMNSYGTHWYCPSLQTTNAVNSPIDWNCDGDTIDNPTVADINLGPGYNGAGAVLISQNDWDNLIYAGGAIGSPGATFADLPAITPWVQELDVETDKLIHPEKYEARELSINIDIKPSSFPNSINLRGRGKTPVAVLGSAMFDVTTIDRMTVIFADAPALNIGATPEDINKDGFLDIVFHFDTQSLNLPVDAISACLTGTTSDHKKFKGCDSVRLIASHFKPNHSRHVREREVRFVIRDGHK